ncbi:hypothetical protein [Zooshikella ganghwensis]|uniref:hypothetical protein n=1 Tax=Zooshikella ganghwensis TaxID=202772 RepID=UPI0003F9D915|nr:hypothetical protein [Zooshikella ganghwensis]
MPRDLTKKEVIVSILGVAWVGLTLYVAKVHSKPAAYIMILVLLVASGVERYTTYKRAKAGDASALYNLHNHFPKVPVIIQWLVFAGFLIGSVYCI